MIPWAWAVASGLLTRGHIAEVGFRPPAGVVEDARVVPRLAVRYAHSDRGVNHLKGGSARVTRGGCAVVQINEQDGVKMAWV